MLPFVRTSENDRKRRARGFPASHGRGRWVRPRLFLHSAWFFNAKKSGDAKWYSLQTNLGSRRDLLATVYSPQMRDEASALA